ncbi:MAG: hypothetical protein HLX50_15710 [Alteromonadaceae bacterium]|nr:hypothetical protein [Alteromonadaceae bacterium]
MSNEATFSESELLSVNGLRPSISGPSELSRFTQQCVNYYHRWLESSEMRLKSGSFPPNQAALFIYAEAPDIAPGIPLIDKCQLKRTHSKTLSVESGIVVCNETLRSCFRVPTELAEADDIMDYVLDNLRADQTFVIMLMAKQKLLVHHAGFPIDEWYDEPAFVNVSNTDNAISLESVDEQLNVYHDEHTRTPLGCTARLMWKKNEGKLSLHHLPELHVQTTLLTHLKAWYKRADIFVHEEAVNSGGRVDIQLNYVSDGKGVKSTLELKILKPNESDQENLKWGLKGIQQAKDYMNHETEFSMACLFDARTDKSDPLSSLEPSAGQAGVQLRRYLMKPPVVKKIKSKKTSKAASNKGDG